MMRKSDARGAGRLEPGPFQAARLTRSERRDALLDSAVALVTSGDIHDVSMETVAEMAGVSRPLVYKHFANRDELLAAVYTREATSLHEELAAEVAGAETVEEMYRTLIRGSLRAAAARGHVFAALRAAGGWSREVREEQHSRDRETVRAFSARAAREYHLDRRLAAAVCAALLGAIDSLLAQWRVRPTSEHALVLEDVYMGMVAGGFAAVGAESSVMSSS